MREISTGEITKNVKEMCIEANLTLTEDVKGRLYQAEAEEKKDLGKQILGQLKENLHTEFVQQL